MPASCANGFGGENMIDRHDYLYFCERALDGMSSIVRELGDELANRRPALQDANTPFALLTHCLGVIDYWSGYLVAGKESDRSREEEFSARGRVEGLLQRIEQVKEEFRTDVVECDPKAPLRGTPPASFHGPDRELNQGAVLQHVYEELAQHHGQMEISRDVILAEESGALVTAGEQVRP
jgi:hypothetical protein